MRSILFVCTANICRSPTAEGVLRKILASRGAATQFDIDSAGTHEYYAGKPPYPQAVAVAKARGYDLTHLVARRIRSHDFDHFDLVLGMDRSHLASLRTVCPTRCKHKIELLLDYGERFHGKDVPDPYGGEVKDFEVALEMIEDGCRGLADVLVRVA
jgi:protein-tyrosine phosphatase